MIGDEKPFFTLNRRETRHLAQLLQERIANGTSEIGPHDQPNSTDIIQLRDNMVDALRGPVVVAISTCETSTCETCGHQVEKGMRFCGSGDRCTCVTTERGGAR
jgi:hypothetical protein